MLDAFNIKAKRQAKRQAEETARLHRLAAARDWPGFAEAAGIKDGALQRSPMQACLVIAAENAWEFLPRLIPCLLTADIRTAMAAVLHAYEERGAPAATHLKDWEAIYQAVNQDPPGTIRLEFNLARATFVKRAASAAAQLGFEEGVAWALTKPEYDRWSWGPLLTLAEKAGSDALAASLIRAGADIDKVVRHATEKDDVLRISPETAARLEAWQAAYAPKRPANKLVL